MGANSKIEWTHHTFNPWIGCTKVAEGCTHCYAEAFAKRTGKAQWGPSGTRIKTGESYWLQPLKWDREASAAGERRRVFCASLADVFEDWRDDIYNSRGERLWTPRHGYVSDEAMAETPQGDFSGCRPLRMCDLRERLFYLLDQTPHLDWLLLTKRPENIRPLWGRPCENPPSCPAEFQEGDIFASALARYRFNAWLGTSIATQADARRNLPFLLSVRDKARVLFASIEPLLEHVDIRPWLESDPRLDLVIVGGESGHKARPMHPQWARSLRDQCLAAGVPYFFKQWGEFKPVASVSYATNGGLADGTNRVAMLRDGRICFRDRGPALAKETIDPQAVADFDRESARWEREFKAGRGLPEWETSHPLGYQWMAKVGKERAGRLLDGREWSELPRSPVPAESVKNA